ncbi:MAG: hypothetical protein H6737_08560 [Alphaproteobacteria bacterium]|nr:hypothetical protein [Alphaproteobacteria bacterium]
MLTLFLALSAHAQDAAPDTETDAPMDETAEVAPMEEAPAPEPAPEPAGPAAFESPLKSLMGPEGIAILADGSELKGKPYVIPKGIGNIKKLTIKTDDGAKHKLGPADIQSFALKPNGLAKMASTGGSVVAMSTNTDVLSKEYAYFVPAPLPNGKMAILQHLNRGMDSKIQIFADPAGRETSGVGVGGVQITGGMLKSYLVYKVGSDASFLVKKGTYDKLWPEIYGDCAGLTQPEKPEFDDFATHVQMYEAKCGG